MSTTSISEWLDGLRDQRDELIDHIDDPARGSVAVHLDGIWDSARAIDVLFESTLSTESSYDTFETLAIELDIQMQHVIHHFTELRQQLVEKDVLESDL